MNEVELIRKKLISINGYYAMYYKKKLTEDELLEPIFKLGLFIISLLKGRYVDVNNTERT